MCFSWRHWHRKALENQGLAWLPWSHSHGAPLETTPGGIGQTRTDSPLSEGPFTCTSSWQHTRRLVGQPWPSQKQTAPMRGGPASEAPLIKKAELLGMDQQYFPSPQCLHQQHPEFNFLSPIAAHDAVGLLQESGLNILDDEPATVTHSEVGSAASDGS